MNAHSVVSRCRSALVAGGFALIFPLSGLALDNVPPEALSVKVFSDRYVAAGKPFSDLAALEAELSRVIILNEEPPLVPETQAVSQSLLAAHELVQGLIAKLQK